MSDLLCERCGVPALVIYERKPLCGPCAVEALDEDHHYLVVRVDDREPDTSNETPAETSAPA